MNHTDKFSEGFINQHVHLTLTIHLVLLAGTGEDVSGPAFRDTVESNLAGMYDTAFKRFELIRRKTGKPPWRPKRESTSGEITVQVSATNGIIYPCFPKHDTDPIADEIRCLFPLFCGDTKILIFRL